VTEIREWWSQGGGEDVGGRRVWVHEPMGSGPWCTLLHGFPSSSHDFWKIAPALAERWTLLTFDLYGFGASDKPVDHDYSIHEQADLEQRVVVIGRVVGRAEAEQVDQQQRVALGECRRDLPEVVRRAREPVEQRQPRARAHRLADPEVVAGDRLAPALRPPLPDAGHRVS